jgi:deoxyribose-phosphate aldolase
MGVLQMGAREFARRIDHTNVRPGATESDIITLCGEAKEYGFASACVASCWAALARERLGGSGVKVCCVVGFPFGSGTSKAFEARDAVEAGADEVDAVINVGYLRSGLLDGVRRELSGIVEASGGAIVKIIIEACYLTDEEKVIAARLARDAGAAFVKTSTGYGPGGATIEDVRLLAREATGIKIKASGGIRTLEAAKSFLEAGASRIGTSSGPRIMEELNQLNRPAT